MKNAQRTPEAKVTQNPTQQIIIALACLSFFPLIYFIGKTIMAIL